MKALIISLWALLIYVSMSNPTYAKAPSASTHRGSMMVVNTPKQRVVNRVPKSSTPLKVGGQSYIRHNSKFYAPYGRKYLRTPPPFGFRVSVMPALFTTFVFNSMTYYLCEGAIYRSLPDSEYEVVRPEVGMILPELPDVNVSKVVIDDVIYFKFDDYLYRQIPTADGVQYEVVGTLID